MAENDKKLKEEVKKPKEETKKPKEEPKVSTPPSKPKKTKKYSSSAYCDIIGATDSIRFVADMKFKNNGRETLDKWKEKFKKQGLI